MNEGNGVEGFWVLIGCKGSLRRFEAILMPVHSVFWRVGSLSFFPCLQSFCWDKPERILFVGLLRNNSKV